MEKWKARSNKPATNARIGASHCCNTRGQMCRSFQSSASFDMLHHAGVPCCGGGGDDNVVVGGGAVIMGGSLPDGVLPPYSACSCAL